MKNIDNFTFWDIALANVIFTDGSDSKLRPVLILYANGNDYTILKMSSQNMIGDVLSIEPDALNNLKITTGIDLKKISSFDSSLFLKKIWSLDNQDKEKVQKYRLWFVWSW